MAGADGEEGRHGVQRAGRAPGAAQPGHELHGARRALRRQGPRRARPRLALRSMVATDTMKGGLLSPILCVWRGHREGPRTIVAFSAHLKPDRQIPSGKL